MTEYPRYSPRPQSGYSAPNYYAAPDRSAAADHYTAQDHYADPNQVSPGYRGGYPQPHNGQYASQPRYRFPYDPSGGGAGFGVRPPVPAIRRQRSGAVTKTASVLAIAALSAGIGAGVVLVAQPDNPMGSSVTSVASDGGVGISAANVPFGQVEQVAAKVVPSVVMLETRIGRRTEEGSGIILSSDGLILTNNHVVVMGDGSDAARAPQESTKPQGPNDGSPSVPNNSVPRPSRTVTFSDGRTASFSLVGADPFSDIAVVRAEGMSGLTPIALGSSADLKVGQDVVAIGSPLGLDSTVTVGVVSALDRPVAAGDSTDNPSTVLDAIQTDAAINPGNSGGALVNMNGELVGVNSAIATVGGDSPKSRSGSIGLGFAIPIDQAKRIADELISTGKAEHASLGVQVTSDPTAYGATIIAVVPGGAAAQAGLPKDVVVTRVDDRVIGSGNELVAAIRSKVPGEAVTLTYVNKSGSSRVVQVILDKAAQ